MGTEYGAEDAWIEVLKKDNERLRKEVDRLRDDLLLVTKERNSALHWLNLPLRIMNDS